MVDYLRQLLFALLTIAVIASVWITAWAQSAIEAAERNWWPANDPALVQRTFRDALRTDPPQDPRHPAHFGPRADLHELMNCD